MKRSLGQSTTSAGGGPPSDAEAEEEAEPMSKCEWLLERFPLFSYLFVPILCIPPCYWPFSWPRLRRKKVEGHRVHRRDYLDYEECTLEKRRNKAAARQFIIDNDLSGSPTCATCQVTSTRDFFVLLTFCSFSIRITEIFNLYYLLFIVIFAIWRVLLRLRRTSPTCAQR